MSYLLPAALLLSVTVFSGAAFAEDVPPQDPAAGEAPPVEEAPAVGPTTYKLDAGQGLVYVQVLKDSTTIAAGLSHDHVMQAKGFSGSFTWNPADPASCAIDVTVPVAQLDVDPQWLRDKVGYTGNLSDGDRKTIKKNMLAKDQLDGDTHPNITFKAKSCAASGARVNVTGDLSIRGKAKTVTVPMAIDADGSKLSASGQLKATHTDFGFEPFSAGFGALKNQNDLSWTINLVGVAQ